MRIFISEFVCGGGWSQRELTGSLAREGRAMLCAVVDDFARLPGVRVTTTWDARLGTPPFADAHAIVVDSPDDEPAVFVELARVCDAALVIAPETGGVLADRCRLVEAAGGRLLGPSSSAVDLCASKSRLGSVLQSHGVPSIATETIDCQRSNAIDGLVPGASRSALTFPLVIKPDNGAGSQSTYLVRDRCALEQLAPELAADPLLRNAVWQPFVSGRAVSMAVIVSEAGTIVEFFPPAEQILSDDGRFQYLGGVVPARGVDRAGIEQTAGAACEAVAGLRGYVGIDLIVPDADPARPLVVEINPRLTSSYIGYRQLTDGNLAGRMLAPHDSVPIAWRGEVVMFSTVGDGTLCI